MLRPGRLVRAALVFLALSAVAQELNKPESERAWHGRIFGVPYDFRWPTWRRFRDAYWNPNDERIFTDRPIGVGWAVNLARLLPWVRAAYLKLAEQRATGADRPGW